MKKSEDLSTSKGEGMPVRSREFAQQICDIIIHSPWLIGTEERMNEFIAERLEAYASSASSLPQLRRAEAAEEEWAAAGAEIAELEGKLEAAEERIKELESHPVKEKL